MYQLHVMVTILNTYIHQLVRSYYNLTNNFVFVSMHVSKKMFILLKDNLDGEDVVQRIIMHARGDEVGTWKGN